MEGIRSDRRAPNMRATGNENPGITCRGFLPSTLTRTQRNPYLETAYQASIKETL